MPKHKWNQVRRERKLRKLTQAEAAREIGISIEALSGAEQDLALEPTDQLKVDRWLDDIGRAQIARVEKLEELAEVAASLPPGLGEAALASLAEKAAEVFDACSADNVGGRAPLTNWAESVEAEWENAGGLRQLKGEPR